MAPNESRDPLDQGDNNHLASIVLMDEPERSDRIMEIIATSESHPQVNWELILERITFLGAHVDGFMPEEIVDFQNEIVRKLYTLLDHPHFIEYLRFQERNLIEVNEGIKKDIDKHESNIIWMSRYYSSFFIPYRKNQRLILWLQKIIDRIAPNQKLNLVNDLSRTFTQREIAIVCDMLDIPLAGVKGLELLKVYALWEPSEKSGTKSLYKHKIDRTFYNLSDKKVDEPKLKAIQGALELLSKERGLLDSRKCALALKALTQQYEKFYANYYDRYGR